MPVDDQEAVRLCRGGDRNAFRHLVDRYSSVLLGTAYLMTRDRPVAEEIVQDAFLSAWRGLGSFRLGSPVKPWLVRIVVNGALSHQRRSSLPTVPIPDVPEPAAPDRTEDEAANRDAVRRGLAELSAEHRQAVMLRYFAELTVPEMSEVLGWPEGTVKSRLHRALAQLRDVLGEP